MFVSEDLNTLNEVFHPLAMLCWQSENPHTMSREECREDLRETFARRNYHNTKIYDTQIEFAGKVATVSCQETHSFEDYDTPDHYLVRMTFIKSKGRWQILTKVTARQPGPTLQNVIAETIKVDTPMGLDIPIMSIAEAMQQTEQQLPELIKASNQTSDKNSLRIIAFIDGLSHLVVQGDEIRWHNEQHAAPGRLAGAKFPTIINGERWQPQWPTEEEVSGDVWSASRKLPEDTGSSFAPKELSLIRARGPVKISEVKPEGFTITFDDGPPLGGDWYSIIIHLQSRD